MVTVEAPTGDPAPTGSVALSGGGYGPVSLSLTGGSATFDIPAWTLQAGTGVKLTAAYTPDANSSSTYAAANGTSTVTVEAATPTVTVQPGSSSITTAQPLQVTVIVGDGVGSPAAAGTVTLSSGSYSSGAVALSSGIAMITIPAGSLAVGSDTLTAAYTPGGASTEFYTSATGATPSASPVVVTASASGPIQINDPETITVTDTPVVQLYDVSDPETITVTDIAQVTVLPQLTITTASPLPQGTVGQSYSVTLTASGGSGTGYTWQVLTGPALTAVGLSLSPGGTIGGTPDATESASSFIALVTDSLGNTAIKTLVLTVGNPVPVISSVSPPYTSADSQISPIVVFGSGFVPGSTVYWNGSALAAPQLVGATLLSAQLPNSDVASAGIDQITVVTPGPGGGTSNVWQFEVSPAGNGTSNPPIVTAVNGAITPGASATYSISLPALAANVSVQCLNLPAGASCSYANGTLTIATSSTLTPAGTYTIVVVLTYTLPGRPMLALFFLPLLLLPLAVARRRWARARILLIAGVGLVLLTFTNLGCTAEGTHQTTSTFSVTLIVQ
jgi:hypothetical protein